MSHSYCTCLVHCAFSTKGRRNLISDDLRVRLWPYMGGVAREHEMTALAVGGTANHAHLLLALKPAMPVAKALQLLKGASSAWVNETFPTHHGFAWQEGYGAFSIGASGVDDTIAYIHNQEQHHQTVTFEQEFVAFLKRHGLAFDDRYVWG